MLHQLVAGIKFVARGAPIAFVLALVLTISGCHVPPKSDGIGRVTD